MTEYQKRKNNGESVNLSANVLSRWKNKIIMAEQERERIKEKNEETYDQIQKVYLDSKLTLFQPEVIFFLKKKKYLNFCSNTVFTNLAWIVHTIGWMRET